jgi:hypothetical protein
MLKLQSGAEFLQVGWDRNPAGKPICGQAFANAPNGVTYSFYFGCIPAHFERMEYELGIASKSVIMTVFAGARDSAHTIILRHDINAPITAKYIAEKASPPFRTEQECAMVAEVAGIMLGRGE